jgi:hypothetical protein
MVAGKIASDACCGLRRLDDQAYRVKNDAAPAVNSGHHGTGAAKLPKWTTCTFANPLARVAIARVKTPVGLDPHEDQLHGIDILAGVDVCTANTISRPRDHALRVSPTSASIENRVDPAHRVLPSPTPQGVLDSNELAGAGLLEGHPAVST